MNLNNKQQRGKKGFGAQYVAKNCNASHITSPNDRDIYKDTLRVAVHRGGVGGETPKRGRPSIIPSEFTNTVSKQAIIMQVAGHGEAKLKVVVNTDNVLIFGTKWAGKINTNNMWSKECTKHPIKLQPLKVKDSEDRWVNWLSYKYINELKYLVKDLLIDMNMVKYKPGWISNICFLVYLFTTYMLRISYCFFYQMVYGPSCHSIIPMIPGIFQHIKNTTNIINSKQKSRINYSILWKLIIPPFRRACCRKSALYYWRLLNQRSRGGVSSSIHIRL